MKKCFLITRAQCYDSLFLHPSQELAPKENRNVDLLASPCYASCAPAYARRPKANRNVDFVRIREGPRDALNRKVSGPYRACLFLCPRLVLWKQGLVRCMRPVRGAFFCCALWWQFVRCKTWLPPEWWQPFQRWQSSQEEPCS